MTPDRIEKQYGIGGAYTEAIATPEGSLNGTVVPVPLADGRRAGLVIPTGRNGEPHAAYI